MTTPQSQGKGAGGAGKTTAFGKLRRSLSGHAHWALGATAVALATWTGTLRAGTIYVPNYSFESPVVPEIFPYATNALDEWEESPQPSDYDPLKITTPPGLICWAPFTTFPFPAHT